MSATPTRFAIRDGRRHTGVGNPLTLAALTALLVALLGATSCSVDERELRVATVAAASSQDAGGAGTGSAPVAGGRNPADARQDAAAEAASGAAGQSRGGQAGANSSAGGALGLGGDDSAGSAGAPPVLPCGDLDHNAVDDCQETLVHNSRFDTDLSDWLPEDQLAATWDARNARGGVGSGSLLLSNIAAVVSVPGAVMVGAEQCIPVTGGASYELAARVLIPSGQGAGEAGFNLWVFADAGCATAFLGAETLTTTASGQAWALVEGQVKMPVEAQSMTVRLVVAKPFIQQQLNALFDDVLIRKN